jgi:hypothetical protein
MLHVMPGDEQAQFDLTRELSLRLLCCVLRTLWLTRSSAMLLRWWTWTLCALLQGSPHIAGLVKPTPRRTATRFSQCGFMCMRADSGDSSDEPLLIASASRADDDLSARLAFDDLATRKVSFLCICSLYNRTIYMCSRIKTWC